MASHAHRRDFRYNLVTQAQTGPQPKRWKFPRGMQFGVTIVRVARAYATQGQLHKCSLIYLSILSLILSYVELGGELASEATRAGGNMRTTRAHYPAGIIGFYASP